MFHLDEPRFLRELEMLVNMDSGLGNPDGITAVGAFFAQRMQQLGWLAEQVDVGSETGKCTIIRNREADHYDVLLVGHVDTVFPTGETAKRPFRRDDRRAYGLGVIDMKQGDLAILHVLEQLPPEVIRALNIVVVLNPDEEIGSIYSASLIDSYARRCDYAFVFEAASTDGSHTVQRKGRCTSRVVFRGRAGHAGYLLESDMRSAVNELLYWGVRLNQHTSVELGTSVNIGVISGGKAANIVPDLAEMTFEARYETPEEQQRLLDTLTELQAHARQAMIEAVIVEQKIVPPLYPSEKTLAYIQHIRTLSEANGIPFSLKKRGGLSDANHIAACGPVCLDGLGPTGDFDHSDREYLELSTIEPNLRFAWLLLTDLAAQKEDA